MTGARPLKLLFISTSVAPLGSGTGGGVELTLLNLTTDMRRRGHHVEIIAPEDSFLGHDVPVKQIPGALQPKAQLLSRKELPASPDNSVLSNMCEYAHKYQHRYDLIVNFSYDWLPLYLTSDFDTPLIHFITMSSLNDAMDFEIHRVANSFPDRLACYSHSQANTFPDPEAFLVLGSGIDLDQYSFCETPDEYVCWVGRISKEKALEDAVKAVQSGGYTLKIMGKMEDRDYWNEVINTYGDTQLQYEGFLPTPAMQSILRKSKALLMTPRWVEAFGIVSIEALACGVPVISYNRGGPSEIIEDGKTGFLSRADSIPGLLKALGEIENIDRKACRQAAEENYSLEAWGDRTMYWFQSCLTGSTAFL